MILVQQSFRPSSRALPVHHVPPNSWPCLRVLNPLQVAQMKAHKTALEKSMAEGNENSKRDIVCEVQLQQAR